MSEEHPMTPPVPETTRSFSFVTHTQLVEAYDAYVHEVGKVPRIEIRGSVEFVKPGQRPNTWRKKREVDLSDWYEVREWRRDEALLMIWYTVAKIWNYPQQERTIHTIVRTQPWAATIGDRQN